MKHLLRLLASFFIVPLFSWSTVANGQITSWDLADGLRASIPDPDNLATAMNPVQVGTATWGFRAGGGQPHYTTAVKGPSSVGGSNVELPHDGVMWWNGPDAGPPPAVTRSNLPLRQRWRSSTQLPQSRARAVTTPRVPTIRLGTSADLASPVPFGQLT
jgi:hypothetical protein